MGKSVTVFKDIGKACKDLLEKDYKVGKNTIEVKSKLPSGVTVTPLVTKAGDALSGSLATKYTFAKGVVGEATLGTSGSLECNLELADLLSPGLNVTCELAKGKTDLLGQANMIAEYSSEAFACKTSFDPFKGDLLASCSTAMSDLTCGLDCVYSTGKGALAKVAAACQYVQPDFAVSAKCEDKGGNMTLGCSYFHKVSSDMQLGVSLTKPMAKPDVGIEFGTAYKLDKDTSVKGKVNSEGILFCSYKQKLSAKATMTLAACVDTINLADNKHKFGLAMNFEL